MNNDNDLIEKVMEKLAEHIGVEREEILPDFTFTDDLHMSPALLTEFIESLNEMDIDTSKLDMTEIETVEDFIETLESIKPID